MRRLAIANTWCWPVGDDFHFKSFSFLMSSGIGQYLIKRHNIFVNTVMPKAVGDRHVLTPEIMAHYRHAQPTPVARSASAALPDCIVGASEWLDSIWRRPRLERPAPRPRGRGAGRGAVFQAVRIRNRTTETSPFMRTVPAKAPTSRRGPKRGILRHGLGEPSSAHPACLGPPG